MTKFPKLWKIAALAGVLHSWGSAMAQNTPTTMQVLMLAGANKLSPGTPPTGEPAAGVSIYVLAGANKFSPAMPPTGTTSSIGAFVFPPGLLSATKPRTQMEVYEVCVNGQKAVFVIPKGTEDQLLPKGTGDCQRRYLGFFWLDGGPNVFVNLGLGGGVTQARGGPVTGVPLGHPLISLQVGGALGLKNLGGTSGKALPGGTFSTPSSNAFAGDLSAAVNVGPVVFSNTLWRANAIGSNSSTSLPGGGTDTAKFNQQFEGEAVTAGIRIPLGSKASFDVHGGGNFWRVSVDTKETVTNGTTSTTTTNTRTTEGRGWTTGAVVQVDMSRRWSFVMRYDYLPMNNAGVNVHLHDGSVGIMIRLTGLRPK